MRNQNAGGRNWLFFLARPENDLVLVYGRKLSWFYCEDRNWIDFVCGAKWLVFSVRIDWLGFWVGGQNLHSFCVRAENDLVLCGHWNWLDFCVGGRNWLDVSMQDRHWLDFSEGIGIDLNLCGGQKWLRSSLWIEIVFWRGTQIDLNLVWGSKLTWFQCWGQN